MVYPRVCGGTTPRKDDITVASGLSPRVRGNRVDSLGPYAGLGSIPACAGEPEPRTRYAIRTAVYPRVCGGTTSVPAHPSTAKGLSPRVRGNPRRLHAAHVLDGSIPACAGEPEIGLG